ncbi:hypothetical protein [Thalassospira marina]|uniref:Phosphohydrolase n=1 Tax=Thalassospira marina TaxID=2048283 RepID=A0ABN5FLG5_9PROT|nr:hypothetical protein [Thalassospira marina]AUG55293.1 hypothetical protein CSC3H3_20640 [Thalassospira marina]
MRDVSLVVKHPSDCQLLFARKARGLAHLRRWNGACDVSVAQHCVMACDNVSQRAAPYALIHDIEEDETGDLLTPVKQKMREIGIWGRFEAEIVLPIRKFYTELTGVNWPWPADVVEEVAYIDQRLQVAEYRDAVDRGLVRGFVPREVAPLPEYVLPWSPQKAEAQFLDRVGRLFPAGEG